MASDFENGVNAKLPGKVGVSVMPSSGNATAGKVPMYTGVGLLTAESDPGGSLPTSSLGFLHDDGYSNRKWQSPFPVDGYGSLMNDGFGGLSWQTSSSLPSDGYGFLHNDGTGNKAWQSPFPSNNLGSLNNDGVGGLSWIKQYVANNTDRVFTVSNVGGGGQYNTIQAAATAAASGADNNRLNVILVFPGLYVNPNVSFPANIQIAVVAAYPGFATDGTSYSGLIQSTVEFRYNLAPTDVSGAYMLFNAGFVVFYGIYFTLASSMTSLAYLFHFPTSTLGAVELSFCKVSCLFGNTDSMIFRANGGGGNANAGIYFRASDCFIQTSYVLAVAGSNGFITPFYVASNGYCNFDFVRCQNNWSLGNASVTIAYGVRCAGTPLSQQVYFIGCDKLYISGIAAGVLRAVYTSNPLSVNFINCDIDLFGATTIHLYYTDHATIAVCTIINCSVWFLSPTAGGSVTIAESAVFNGGTLRIVGGIINTAATTVVVGPKMILAPESAYVSTAGIVANIVPADNYGYGIQVGTKPTFAREDHSHGTPPPILVGATKITVSVSAPVSPAEGEPWLDIR